MSESTIEEYLVKKVKAKGGICKKWISPGWSGVPDRIAIIPGGKITFIELKDYRGKLRKLQAYRSRQLRELGCDVYCINSREAVDLFIKNLSNH